MAVSTASQRDHALRLLRKAGMARLGEFQAIGVTATTVSRLEKAGEVVRLARGLYQLPDAELHTHHSLAEAAKLVPKGVICLASALAFHGLTDHTPAKVWLAIGNKQWRPRIAYPPLRIARFPDRLLASGVETHRIEGTAVRIFGVAKTVADLFRYRRTVGDVMAIEGLRAALRQRKARAADIAHHAHEGGVWKTVEPYLTALTSDA
jgi:predicted transcriptional regulator of viral defense system